MRVKTVTCLGLSVVLAVWAGCRSVSPTVRGAHDTGVELATPHVAVVVPPGLDPKAVTPKQGDDLARALLTLDEVVALLPSPDYLPVAIVSEEDGHVAEPSPLDSPDQGILGDRRSPPLAAQRAYLSGRQAWREGQNFAAISHLQSALRLAPESAPVLRLLGHIYAQSGNKVRGGVYLQQAVRQNPDDVDSLFVLGRLASEQGRWSDSVATLAYAQRIEGGAGDPAMPLLIRYFLGLALAHEGYDAAAIAQLNAYLQRPKSLRRTTRLVHQLMLLDRQRVSTWQTVGDALIRLDRPGEALKVYEQAVRLDPSGQISAGLARRIVYAGLRTGQHQAVLSAVLRYVQESGAEVQTLELVRYLSQVGIEREGLAGVLRKVYDRSETTGFLAMAIADLLGVGEAEVFLDAHLREHPEDRAVYEYLVKRLLGDERSLSEGSAGLPSFRDSASREGSVQRVVGVAAELMGQLPSAAKEYTDILTEHAGEPAGLLETIGNMSAQQRRLPGVRYITAMVMVKAGRVDDAITELEGAVAGGADSLPAVRIELATLLLDRGQADRAAALLEGLPDESDLRMVRLKLRVLLEGGDTAGAMELLDRRLARDTVNTVDLVIEKAKLQLVMGQSVQAHQTLLDALDTHPRAEPLYERLLVLYHTNQLPRSEQLYKRLVQKMLSQVPLSRVARIERAKLLVASSRYEQAEPLLRELLDEKPDDTQPLETMLLLLARTDRRAEAAEMIGRHLERSPSDRRLLSVALRYYRQVKDKARMIEVAGLLLDNLLADKSRDITSIDALLEIMTEAGQNKQAEAKLDEWLDQQPEDRGLLLLARQHYERTGSSLGVLEMTERLLLLGKPGVVRSQSLAALYLQHDQPQKAVEVLTRAMKQDDLEPETASEPEFGGHIRMMVRLLARAWSDLDKPEEAGRQFVQAIERFPNLAADLSFDWAMHCERCGDQGHAESILVDLLKESPKHALANNALGYAWADRGGDLARAKEMIQIAINADPDNAAYLDSMGWVLYKQGRFNDAMTWLQRATAAPGGDYPVILDHLGDALYRVGHHKLAAGTWRQAQAQLGQEDAEEDPELVGLAERLNEKIRAVKAGGEPTIADAPGLALDRQEADSSQEEDQIDTATPGHELIIPESDVIIPLDLPGDDQPPGDEQDVLDVPAGSGSEHDERGLDLFDPRPLELRPVPSP